jgi:hypothetical protein
VIDQPVKLGDPLAVVFGGVNVAGWCFFFVPALPLSVVVVLTATLTTAWSSSCTFCPVGEVPVTEATLVKPLATTSRPHW